MNSGHSVNKGVIVLLAVGLGFLYFATNIVKQVEDDNPRLQNNQSRKAKENLKYYIEDSNGDLVLDFSSESIAKSKLVWKDCIVKKEIMGYFPNFDTMKQIVNNKLIDSKFKTFFLNKLNKTENDYISGNITLDQAKAGLNNL